MTKTTKEKFKVGDVVRVKKEFLGRNLRYPNYAPLVGIRGRDLRGVNEKECIANIFRIAHIDVNCGNQTTCSHRDMCPGVIKLTRVLDDKFVRHDGLCFGYRKIMVLERTGIPPIIQILRDLKIAGDSGNRRLHQVKSNDPVPMPRPNRRRTEAAEAIERVERIIRDEAGLGERDEIRVPRSGRTTVFTTTELDGDEPEEV